MAPARLLAHAIAGAVIGIGPPPATYGNPPAPVSVAGVRVAVVSANVHKDLGPRAARHDFRIATAGSVSVVLSQENWHRRPGRLLPAGWRAFQTGSPVPGCRGTVVAWKGRTWARTAAWATFLGGDRCATVAVLRHRATGRLVPFVSVHLIPHVEVAGWPRPLPDRIRLYHRQVDAARALAARLRDQYGRAIVGGDWNVDWSADRRVAAHPFPFRHFHTWWDSNWRVRLSRPTHGHRRIDTVWWPERRVFPVSAATRGRTRSDHNFVRVTVTVPRRVP